MSERSQLRALADRAGILPSFRGSGGVLRVTPDATREALLGAMGLDASTEAAASATLEALDAREAGELVDRVRVAVQGTRAAARLPLRRPPGAPARGTWHLELRDEAGGTLCAEIRTGAPAALPLPADLGPGVFDARVVLEADGGPRETRQRLFVVPRRCVAMADVLGHEPAFGLTANLYTLRSRRDWGAGDLADLERLLAFADEAGAALVGISPLHHLWNRHGEVSPYSPVSRLYRNPLYLDVEAVPELADCEEARARLAHPELRARLERARNATHVDYDGVGELKREVLEPLHRTFAARHRDRPTPRGRAYAAWREEQGRLLTDFATFVALSEHPPLDGEHDWRRWPEAYRDPASAEVGRFREAHPEEVDIHAWIQFELDRQLAACARAGEGRVRLLQDLAVGSPAGSADAWMGGDLFATGARLGAPPDAFNPGGQEWGLPPLDPRRLREQGYAYWRRLLQASFAHSDALRIDHAMGLSRLYWIPAGRPPEEGAYVRYPAEDLLGVLALESRRAGAFVIGEDLGTVPTGFASRLARWGILSWRVLYFERKGASFRPPGAYSRRALVTANTHDLPPLAGFARGRDLELRRRAGSIATDDELSRALEERRKTCRALARRLRAEGLLGPHEDELPPPPRLGAVISAFLDHTPAPLVGLALDDLVGETEPVNLPGTTQDEFPSWRRRMAVSLEELPKHPGARETLRAMSARSRAAPPVRAAPSARS